MAVTLTVTVSVDATANANYVDSVTDLKKEIEYQIKKALGSLPLHIDDITASVTL